MWLIRDLCATWLAESGHSSPYSKSNLPGCSYGCPRPRLNAALAYSPCMKHIAHMGLAKQRQGGKRKRRVRRVRSDGIRAGDIFKVSFFRKEMLILFGRYRRWS